jgi:uncharacterized protein
MSNTNQTAGTFCWFECRSKDASKAKPFYTQLFGWNATDVPMPGGGGSYTLLKVGQEDVAGLYEMPRGQFDGVPSHWQPFVSVDDVDDSARRTTSLGGRILMPPADIPGVGRVAVIEDPTGASISIAHFNQHPGTPAQGPFGWSELATRDTKRAVPFYSELFGWTAKPDPLHSYTEFQVAGKSVAGMMAMDPRQGDAPSHWMPYTMVEDCDATVRTAQKLGAEVCVPPTDIEKVGRFAIFSDPAGATLGVIKVIRPDNRP